MKTTLAAIAMAVTAAPVLAAPLDIPTQAPVIDTPFASADYLEFDGAADIFVSGALSTSFDLGRDLILDFNANYDIGDPIGTISGGLQYGDGGELVLGGEITGAGFSDDTLEFVLSNLIGSSAASFGQRAVTTIFFVDPLGVDPFAALSDGQSYDVTVETAAAPVPVPAGLPLLAGALVVMAGTLRARRKTTD